MPKHYILSTEAYDAVFDFLDALDLTTDETMNEAYTRICAAIDHFVEAYGQYPFLKHEKVHEFNALQLYNENDMQQKRTLLLRMILRNDKAYVFSQAEVPLEELYDVRKVITESYFSCYNDGTRGVPKF